MVRFVRRSSIPALIVICVLVLAQVPPVGAIGPITLVKDISTVAKLQPGYYDTTLVTIDNIIYFPVYTMASGDELWKSDGTINGTVLVKDIVPGASGSFPEQIAGLPGSNQALFAASDGMNGMELWRTDGTAAGTLLIQDLAPGPQNANPAHFAVIGTRVFFAANDGSTGEELWSFDAKLIAQIGMYLPIVIR